MQARNFLLFIALSIIILFGWIKLESVLWPPKPQPQKTAESEAKKVEKPPVKPEKEPVKPKPPVDDGWAGVGRALNRVAARRITPADELVTFGSADPNSPYHLQVVLDPKGAGVRSVLLNKFKAADDWGRPTDRLLELVPDTANDVKGSFHLLHYSDPSDDRKPLETLGNVQWQKSGETTENLEGNRERQTVSFQTTIQGVLITKTYSLTTGDYHLGLSVTMKRLNEGEKPLIFRYQLVAHGLPIEGRWYTSIFHNALIAQVNKNSVLRDLQDIRQISTWGGGKPIVKEKDHLIRYAGVGVQYFASVIVVDDDQKTQDFIARARPTLETYVLKGVVKSVSEQGTVKFEFETDDHREETIYVHDDSLRFSIQGDIAKGKRIAVVATTEATTDGRGRTVALELADYESTQPLWRDDITVRVVTEPIELRKAGDEVVHKYLLYNGPMKPSLLGMPGHETVADSVLARYTDKLKLNTLTDYQSPGVFGTVSSTIYWTDVIIKCTNVMHWVLSQINRLIPNYGLCIIFLTVLVRAMMFPVSRKQALMSLRMQELAPEMKKLQEKHKGDRQAIGTATMELYRKHNVNPFGTCWFIVLQMPVFMGLYYALQESIYFRLAGAWPTWIHNLAAPDMLFRWGESIPWLSRPVDYGGFIYLGPFFNLLPIIAVTLMIFQQKMMTPPAQDEQQAMQQKVMKYMMVFFGLMFYKVAAGLCLYFIASSLWGFAERKLLPKKKLHFGPGSTDVQPILATASGSASTAMTTAPATTGIRGRRQGRARSRQEQAAADLDEGSGSAWSRLRRRVNAWWEEVLRNAEKK